MRPQIDNNVKEIVKKIDDVDFRLNQALLRVLEDNRNLMKSLVDLKQEVSSLREEKVTHISDSILQYQNTDNFRNHMFNSFENLRLVT